MEAAVSTSPLFRHPPELREMIYEHLLAQEGGILLRRASSDVMAIPETGATLWAVTTAACSSPTVANRRDALTTTIMTFYLSAISTFQHLPALRYP